MDLTVEEFIDGLFTKEALETPSDSIKLEQLVLELPPWYDEKKFNQARRFFMDTAFSAASSMLIGLIVVFSVPSILKVLVGSCRSSSIYTAYKRYSSTLQHTISWYYHDLKPGSRSWKSLYAVRSRHLRAGLAAKMKGQGTVSQRDIALTQFGFMGFMLLKSDKFGVRALVPGDWEAYVHFWSVIGYMIGLEDRYNICRKSVDETRQVCQIILDRVYTPCMENPPEYFEHMSRVMMDGLWCINPTLNPKSTMYFTKYLSGVPGYIYTEEERIELETKLKKKGKSSQDGVEVTYLIEKPIIDGLVERPPRKLYLEHYATFDSNPVYKSLTWFEKFKMASISTIYFFFTTYLGRLYYNLNFFFSFYLIEYLPYLAFFQFGVLKSYVNIFNESPLDDTKPLTNEEYLREDSKKSSPWYTTFLPFLR